MESSKISSPTTQEADIVVEDQPRSPILGVSLRHTDNKEKVEVGGNGEKGTPQVDSSPLPLVKKCLFSLSPVNCDLCTCDIGV